MTNVRTLQHQAPALSQQINGRQTGFINLEEGRRPLLWPAQILYRMMIERRTGKLSVCDPREPEVEWQIFMGQGQIHFATCSVGQVERLNYLRLFPEQSESIEPSDYDFLCRYWQSGRISLGQLRSCLVQVTQEALVQILKLSTALISISPLLGLDPLLMSVPLPDLLNPLRNELRGWKKSPEIISPLQRPFVINPVQLHSLCPASRPFASRLQIAVSCLERELCLYQIAQHMNVSLLELLPFINTLVRRHVIEMRPYLFPPVSKPTVICIDKSQQVQCAIQQGLECVGYRVLSLSQPQHLWTSLERNDPTLMLVDVDQFEGYGLMKMLNRTETFKTVPLIALTERQGLVQRFRSRQLGASDCLSKPINVLALRNMVQQLTQHSAELAGPQ